MHLFIRICSVSYTHLDVYKRQQLVIDPLPLPVCILADTGILLGALTFAFLKNHFEKVWIESYQRHNGFEFIGLYDLSGSKSLEGRDILSRDEEVKYLGQMLEELIFSQEGVKQAICLTGKSGCGKSTILSFFKKKYDDVYQIYDLTGSYTNLPLSLIHI